MIHRQTGLPAEWLIVDPRTDKDLWQTIRKLPRQTGVLVLHHELGGSDRRKLMRRLKMRAAARGLRIVDDAGRNAVRAHNSAELRRAMTARKPMILLSPMFPTRSHPEWNAMPRMRAAALARLARRRAIALGGMDRRRFRSIRKLGFIGWAGIDAWIRT
jgi:thiamine-phosphate pyrophosphorylase